MQLGAVLFSASVILLPPVWYPAGAPVNCDVTSYPLGKSGERVMKKANLAGCDLTDAELDGADLRKADLTGAILDGASLNGANLAKALLPGASLAVTGLNGANLGRADLSGALLSVTGLNDAILTRALLVDATISVSGRRRPHQGEPARRDRHQLRLLRRRLPQDGLPGRHEQRRQRRHLRRPRHLSGGAAAQPGKSRLRKVVAPCRTSSVWPRGSKVSSSLPTSLGSVWNSTSPRCSPATSVTVMLPRSMPPTNRS